jgi:protein-S-isoprenylcysteine O-methyltransferase Ste14
MFGRAVFAFLVLPGVVAYLGPLLLAPAHDVEPVWRWAGSVVVVAGSALLLWCVREFYVAGKGTLAPWSPPRNLVRTGLYRWSRNPMYVAVLSVVLGWTVFFRSSGLLLYLACLAVAFHVRVRLFEEPWLKATFGDDWARYEAEVGRWWPRGRGRRGSGR